MKLLGIDHIVLRAIDAGRLERFYVEVLGCTVEKRIEAVGLTLSLIHISEPTRR